MPPKSPDQPRNPRTGSEPPATGSVQRSWTSPNADRITLAAPALARAQARWIVGLEAWRDLGYQTGPLGRFLARMARAGAVYVARSGGRAGAVNGIVVVQDGVLLGGFVALLAVRAEAQGRGIGGVLMRHAETQVAARRRWLYVSTDATNRTALRFYRRLGFSRVGKLPDLICAGHIEILLRKRITASSSPAFAGGRGRPPRPSGTARSRRRGSPSWPASDRTP
jgi:ribosomal protein S18 acetylase RimI-like enzyme